MIAGVRHHLETFEALEKAIEARKIAEDELIPKIKHHSFTSDVLFVYFKEKATSIPGDILGTFWGHTHRFIYHCILI